MIGGGALPAANFFLHLRKRTVITWMVSLLQVVHMLFYAGKGMVPVPRFLETMLGTFLVAMGVIVGGTLVGSLVTVFSSQFPLKSTASLAARLKLWAMVAALGGTFTALENLEAGFFRWELRLVAKQMLLIFSAFAGAHLGYLLILALGRGGGR
ncbi:MAG: YtrH family sporulation protein [Bacillota bacterium]